MKLARCITVTTKCPSCPLPRLVRLREKPLALLRSARKKDRVAETVPDPFLPPLTVPPTPPPLNSLHSSARRERRHAPAAIQATPTRAGKAKEPAPAMAPPPRVP